MGNATAVNQRRTAAVRAPQTGGVGVVVVARHNPCYSGEFFSGLLDRLPAAASVAGVVLLSDGMQGGIASLFGRSGSMRLACRHALDRARGRTAEQVLARNGVPFMAARELTGRIWRYCRFKAPDIIVFLNAGPELVARMSGIASAGCIEIDGAGGIDTAGAMSAFWQMYHGNASTGITMHRIGPEPGRDRVVFHREVPIWVDESLDNLVRRMSRMTAGYIGQVIDGIGQNTLSPAPGSINGMYRPVLPRRADLREFRRRGKQLF